MPAEARNDPWLPIIDPEARDLVLAAEGSQSRPDLLALVAHLARRCALPQVRTRYALPAPSVPGSLYPLDAGGYGQSFDPLDDEHGFWTCWHSHGIVVGRAVASRHHLREATARMRTVLSHLAGPHLDLDDSGTWDALPVDAAGTAFVSRGFFELYHDASLADLRQSVRTYLHHVLIWGRADLWTSFDRMGLKLPEHGQSAALPLHVDQNPRIHPDFRTVQGVLALDDCPAERGTFVGASGSRSLFAAYAELAPERGEYVELAASSTLHAELDARPVPLRAGDLVSWDSRTTHANSANVSRTARWVAYIAAGPGRQHDAAARAARMAAYASGEGRNVRDALMHASKKPRYCNPAALGALREAERLTALGRLLYGLDDYGTEVCSPLADGYTEAGP